MSSRILQNKCKAIKQPFAKLTLWKFRICQLKYLWNTLAFGNLHTSAKVQSQYRWNRPLDPCWRSWPIDTLGLRRAIVNSKMLYTSGGNVFWWWEGASLFTLFTVRWTVCFPIIFSKHTFAQNVLSLVHDDETSVGNPTQHFADSSYMQLSHGCAGQLNPY